MRQTVGDEKAHRSSGRLQKVNRLLVVDTRTQHMLIDGQYLVILLQTTVPVNQSDNQQFAQRHPQGKDGKMHKTEGKE